jgi:LytS/YehU family sensor histidine kinase
MLLPFIENCFKHGLSNMLENPWMNLSIAIQKRELTMKLLNSKPSDQPTNHKRGIGIENVQKRLALLYRDRHQLTITEEEEIFMVVLKMELEEESVQTISVKPRSLVVS